ncbi:MAG: MnmC family methyltransferase [Phormidesmis sp.]
MATFTPVATGDGSSTFYSETFKEWFHSRQGACNEAQKTYVETVHLARRIENLVESSAKENETRQNRSEREKLTTDSPKQDKTLRILDVCYGLGYNTAAALDTIWPVLGRATAAYRIEIKALEIDISVARSAIAQALTDRYAGETQPVLKALARDLIYEQGPLRAQLLLGDARQQIQPLVSEGWQADVIFLDPFSPPHCPQLWTVEFLALVAQCLNPNGGELVTYSCAAAVRSALQLVGLTIGSTPAGGRRWPGTIACDRSVYDSLPAAQGKLPDLSQQEQEHLQTRAAVPYRDPSLTATAEEILKQRSHAQAISPLMPTGPWRRRWMTAR